MKRKFTWDKLKIVLGKICEYFHPLFHLVLYIKTKEFAYIDLMLLEAIIILLELLKNKK